MKKLLPFLMLFGLAPLNAATIDVAWDSDTLFSEFRADIATNFTNLNTDKFEASDVGVTIQAYDAGLLSIAGLTTAADKMIYTTAVDTYAVIDLTAFARTILAGANQAAVISILGIEAGATADQTGAEIKTAYEAEADTNAFTDAEQSKLAAISGTNTGDEAAASTTAAGIAELATLAETDAGTDTARAVTPAGLANILSDVSANTAKTTNATHTGQVTGSGALTVDSTAISDQTLVTGASGDMVLVTDASDAGNLKRVDLVDLLGGGAGTVDTSGVPVLNDFARFTDADTIEGRSYAEVAADLSLEIGTDVQAYDADLTTWAGVTPGTGVATALAVNIGSAGAPVLFNGAAGTPSSIDLINATNTPADATKLPLAGGTMTGKIVYDLDSGLTAGSAGQGSGTVTAEYSEFTTGSANHDVTLAAFVAGSRQVVINNTGNTLDVYPASDDNLGEGVDMLTNLDDGFALVAIGLDTTNGYTTVAAQVNESDLDATNAPTDNYLLSYDSASGGFTWVISPVEDDVYGAGWNGDTANAPSQNAVYDKIESLDTSDIAGLFETVSGANTLTAAEQFGKVFNVDTTSETDLAAGAAGHRIGFGTESTAVLTIDPNVSEVIVLNGTTQTGGVSIVSSGTAGDVAAFYWDDANSQWIVWASGFSEGT